MRLKLVRAGILLCALSCVNAQAAEPAPVVVELFTSQGCSSCPPADALLGQLASRPGLIALSLPITYWDMLGWKDTLASTANTARQRAYAKAMGHGGIYTPQIVVDGVTDVVGSREAKVKAAIAAHGNEGAVAVSLAPEGARVKLALGEGKAAEATIWAFQIQSAATVKIGRGENEGRTITYRNVVRGLKQVGVWKGKAMTLDLPRRDPADPPHDGLAVVVQQGGHGRVLGGAFITRPLYYASR